jgi:DNA-binding NarL/FixJ family response regulator
VISIVVADDQELVRTGFRMILEAQPDFTVVGEACTGREAVEAVRRSTPDVVLMDIRMPGMDGIEATRQITAGTRRTTRVVMLTTFDLDRYVYDSLRAGASAFLLKDVHREHLVASIRSVVAGDSLLAPALTRRLIEEFLHRPPPGPGVPDALRHLTERETEVLGCVARGLSNAEVAAAMVLSEATVKTHVNRMLSKLGLRSRVQAVVLAYETGLVRPGDAPR